MRGLVEHRLLLAGLHLLVILGLLASFAASVVAGRYFTRGIETGEAGPAIPYTDLNPLGINTFLQDEPDPEKVRRSLDMIAAAGFTYIRQPFFWYEIEPQPDVYWDAKWNVSTWEKYDRIVELANARGLEIIARLDKPPRWAREGQPNLDQFPDGPPTRIEDYADFVATVVSRYRGKIRYVQIWNEPNLQGEWGGQPIDPAAFTELLKAAYLAAKQANPDVVVLMPGLAPTDQTGPANLSDLLFLQGMYDAGAADYFDIATAMVYGYGYSPYDRRVGFERNNFSRVIQLREIMVRNGDADKPIWAVEYAWVSLPEGWQGRPSVWGEPVSEEEQARYLYQGYLRAQREWPWIGVMCVWYFRWPIPPDDPVNWPDPTRGFAIVNWDFTPRLAYDVLARARPMLDRAWTGVYLAGSRYLQHDGGWRLDEGDIGPLLRPEQAGETLRIPFAGPQLDLLISGPGQGFTVTIDGVPPAGLPRDEQGRAVVRTDAAGLARLTLASGLDDGPHVAELTALAGGDRSAALAGFAVVRRSPVAEALPLVIGAIGVGLALNLASLGLNFRHPPARTGRPGEGN
uniref:Glycoside hydrolase family 5 domain-containing protein n=2 Tax=Thermorudis TaxID=1649508 RepID=A0A831X898_9BACT